MTFFHRSRDPVPRELAAWEREVRDRIYGGPRTITVAPVDPPVNESARAADQAAERAAHESSTSNGRN